MAMQSRLDAHRPLRNSWGLLWTMVVLSLLTWLPPTLAGTEPSLPPPNRMSERSDSLKLTKAAPPFRKISARKLPLEMLEEFRKDYPAAVELHWQSRIAVETDVMELTRISSAEKLLILRLDSKIYRVQGYNLGQYFTATYHNQRRFRYAVLEKCEDLPADSKSSWQNANPDWTCLGFTRITTNRTNGANGPSLQTRILTTQSDRRQTQILAIDSDGKVRALDRPKQWKRMSYRKIKNETLRLQLLTNTP
ncbi:MAG: hypothetical protein ACKO55_05790 [Bacteroidota bacterium]